MSITLPQARVPLGRFPGGEVMIDDQWNRALQAMVIRLGGVESPVDVNTLGAQVDDIQADMDTMRISRVLWRNMERRIAALEEQIAGERR